MIERIDGGVKVWKYDQDGVHIRALWLFEKLRELFDFDVFLYDGRDNVFTMTGNYPKDNAIKIKKFLYDNYPIVETVILHRHGIKIKFKTKLIY